MIVLKEKNLLVTNIDVEQMSTCEVASLISDLQDYQIHMQSQNEEIKKTRQELQRSRDSYFDLYNFAPVGYFTVDTDGTIKQCNLTATCLLEKRSCDIIGHNITDLIFPEDSEVYLQHSTCLFDQRKREACVLRMYKGNGEFIYVRMESDFFPDEDGLLKISSVFLDVTKVIMGEQQLKKTVDALTKSNTELERFAYVASHDLREPLRNISSCVQLLEKNYIENLDAGAKSLIKYTIEGVNQINSLISDLLAYSKHGSISGCFEKLDFNYILENVLENLKQLILENNAIITFDNLPEIVADSAQISQLLQNLISNAIKHNAGSNVKIHIGSLKWKKELLFFVKDDGCGIEEEYLEKIFEIFRRLESRGEYSGTGIGLAICKQVVEKHGGKIWAESSIGNGSTFYFTLPLR